MMKLTTQLKAPREQETRGSGPESPDGRAQRGSRGGACGSLPYWGSGDMRGAGDWMTGGEADLVGDPDR